MPLMRKEQLIREETNFDREKLLKLVELYKVRLHTLADFPKHVKAFYSEKIDRDQQAVMEHLNNVSQKHLSMWRQNLSRLDSFDKVSIEANCRETAAELNIKPAELIHPARVAISGVTAGAGLFEMMEIMGKDTVFQRIDEVTGTQAG